MNSADVKYITEVLGVKGFAVSSEHVAYEICVLTPFALVPEEKQMIEKMLNSVNVNSILFLNQNENSLQDVLAQSAQHNISHGLVLGIDLPAEASGDSLEGNGLNWTELPSIVKFLDTSDPVKLKTLKQSAWTKLKKLKAKMEGA